MATNALSTSARKSNRPALILAIVFGALSAVLVLAYLSKTRSASSGASGATVPVVVASKDIPERTVIKEGMLEVKQVAADVRHPLAIQEQKRVEGQIARVSISAGEQILSNKIADDRKDVGFAAGVPEGKRGVAVGVTEVVASGGHISPGDYVDVIGLFEVQLPTDKDGKPLGQPASGATAGSGQGNQVRPYAAMTVLQHIQVLAVASNVDSSIDTKDKSGSGSSSSRDQAKSVTLAVTPEQAEKLVMAEELGKIRLSLRPFGEDDQRNIPALTNNLTDLAGP